MTRLPCICLIVLVTALLAGCSGDSSTVKIGVSIPETTAPVYTLIKQAMIDGEKDYGVKVLWNGVRDAGIKQNLATLETQQIRRMLDEGIRVLVLKPVGGKSAYSILKEAERRNVPVITLDRLLVSINVRGHIAVDETGLGEAAAKYAIEEIHHKGNVLVLDESTGAESFRDISLGIYRALDRYSDQIRVHSHASPLNADVALDLTDRVLKNYAGNIQAIIAVDSTIAVGAVRGVQLHELAGSDRHGWGGRGRGSVSPDYVQAARRRSRYDALSERARGVKGGVRCAERSSFRLRCRIIQRSNFNENEIQHNPSHYTPPTIQWSDGCGPICLRTKSR